MPFYIRRYPRRDPRYGPYSPYGYGYPGGWGRQRYGSGNSCLRDACLLETGCCVAESLDGNCLLLGLLLLPRMATMALSAGPGRWRAGAAEAVVSAIRVYQRRISANRATPCCRFSPSCSEYAVEAVQRHGALRGLRLAVGRLLRCRPFGTRGADPVPA